MLSLIRLKLSIGICLIAFQSFALTSRVCAQDLTSVTPDSLILLIQSKPQNLRKVILEAGKTNQKEFINPLTTFLQTNNKLSPQIKWSTHLALARLGEPNAVNYVVQRTKKLGVNDDVVYELFPDLVYTQQRKAFDYMIETIKSDEKNCKSADPENPEAINCAYRILEFLAPTLKDFPLKIDASGDLEVTEYAVALKQAREWFESNPQYQIIK